MIRFATIPAIDVLRLLPFLDFDDVRMWCGAIRVEPASSGCVLVATQGHYLATMPSQAVCTEPFSLQMSERFAHAIKRECKHEAEIVIESREDQAKIVRTGDVVYIHPGPAVFSAHYPEWRAVVPKDDELRPGLVDAFNVKYLQRALRFVRFDGGDYDEASVRLFHKPGGPSVIRKRSMSVTVMPMVNQDFAGAGEWLS